MTKLLQDVKENLLFVGICFGITAALILIALLFERFFIKQKRRLSSTKTVSFVGVFAAVSSVLMLLELPLPFLAPVFYKLDFSEVPVLICTFYLGPVAGVVCELLKVLIRLLWKSTETAFVGEFANFAVGCAFVLPASMLYSLNKTKKGAVAALATGTVVLSVFGSLFNVWYLLPKFAALYGMPLDAIVDMGKKINPAIADVYTFAAFAVAPFNLLKGTVDSVLTFLLYKRIERLLFRK